MKGKQSDKKGVSEKETRKPCGKCRFYNWSTERQFHRKVGPKDEKMGERRLIIEPRAVCRSPTARAKGHLVHRDQTKRPCEYWKAGKYEPQKEEKKKEPETPDEYYGKSKAVEELEKAS